MFDTDKSINDIIKISDESPYIIYVALKDLIPICESFTQFKVRLYSIIYWTISAN